MNDTPPAPVAGIVLAAGAGRRFGMPKALIDYDGGLLVDRAADVLTAGGCAPVVVVLGARADDVRRRAQLHHAEPVINPDWATGMASSLRTALTTLMNGNSSAAIVVPVDMPGVTSAAVRRVAAHADSSALVAATVGAKRSHPVLLGRQHWSGILATATGDSGARDYLLDHHVVHVACDDVSKSDDIDRPEDLRRS